MNNRTNPLPWSVPLGVQDVPVEGQQLRLVADAPTRAAVAKFVGLPEIVRLEAEFAAVPHKDGLHVTGRVSASVGQTCVVTLEPMQSEVNEAIDLLYLRNRPEGGAEIGSPDDEPGKMGDERVESLGNGTVDLGMMATESLILGIDRYPRKPDAVFASPPADGAASSPFAALAGLKTAQVKRGG